MERKRIKAMVEAHPKHKYLLEILSNLVRSIQFVGGSSPYQLGSVQYEFSSMENDLFCPD